MYRDKIQNIIKNLRDTDEEILFWDDISETNLENYLNQEEPDDNDLREGEEE